MIKFKILPKKNPQDLAAPEMFYATAIADGEVDFEFDQRQIYIPIHNSKNL